MTALSPQPLGEPVVRLEGIRKSFGAQEVLHGVDLSVHTGEHVVIFGPSGSGKSTLLRTINLLEEPSAGWVRVLGVEYGPGLGSGEKRGRALELRRHVGMVFQQFNLFPHLSALENIALPLRATRRVGRAEAEDRSGSRSEAGRAPALGGAFSRRALGRAAAARRHRAGAEPRPRFRARAERPRLGAADAAGRT